MPSLAIISFSLLPSVIIQVPVPHTLLDMQIGILVGVIIGSNQTAYEGSWRYLHWCAKRAQPASPPPPSGDARSSVQSVWVCGDDDDVSNAPAKCRFATFFRTGSVIFGGGQVVLPMLYNGAHELRFKPAHSV